MKIKRSNLQSFCRTCLDQLHSADASSNFIISETPNLTKLLIICTTLNVNDDEDYIYPQSLCKKCYDMLQQFRDFRDMALQSAEVLRKIVSDTSEDTTTTSNTLLNNDNYTIHTDVQNFNNEPEYKIEFEITHLQENYLPESTNNIANSFLDSDSSAPTTSTAKKRKLTDDIDEKFQCKIGSCNFNPKSKKGLEEHIKLEHTIDFTLTSLYNTYEIYDVTYEEDSTTEIKQPETATGSASEQDSLKFKKPPKTQAERARDYRIRQKAKRAAELEKYSGDKRYLMYFQTPKPKAPVPKIQIARNATVKKNVKNTAKTAPTLRSSNSVLLKQNVSLANGKSLSEPESVDNILNWLGPLTIKKEFI